MITFGAFFLGLVLGGVLVLLNEWVEAAEKRHRDPSAGRAAHCASIRRGTIFRGPVKRGFYCAEHDVVWVGSGPCPGAAVDATQDRIQP